MKKISLKDRILRFLRGHPEWINGGEIERQAMSVGYKGSTAARELWYLVEEGKIISETRPGKRVASAWFKIKL